MILAPRPRRLLTILALAMGSALFLSPNPHFDRWLSFLVMLPLGLLFLLPPALAAARDHDRFWWILVLTASLGWTVVGWIAALIWALRPLPR